MKPSTASLIALIAFGSAPAGAQGDDLADRDMTLQEIVAALKSNDLSAYDLRAIESYDRIDIVDLSSFELREENQALRAALSKSGSSWAMVQTAIVGIDSVRRELTRRSVEIGRVVAATMDDKGVLTIYVR